jgi:hypothetical protein
MLSNFHNTAKPQDAGNIILTGFEPEIVLSSVRTVIEEYKNINRTQMTQIQQINTDKNSENPPTSHSW